MSAGAPRARGRRRRERRPPASRPRDASRAPASPRTDRRAARFTRNANHDLRFSEWAGGLRERRDPSVLHTSSARLESETRPAASRRSPTGVLEELFDTRHRCGNPTASTPVAGIPGWCLRRPRGAHQGRIPPYHGAHALGFSLALLLQGGDRGLDGFGYAELQSPAAMIGGRPVARVARESGRELPFDLVIVREGVKVTRRSRTAKRRSHHRDPGSMAT